MRTVILSIVAFIAITVAIFFLLPPYRGYTPPLIRTEFIGYTNGSSGPEILIRFTNRTKQVAFWLFAMDQKTEDGWRRVDPPTAYSIYPTNQPLASSFVAGIPVPAEQASWRVVFEFQERAAGPDGILERARESGEKLFTRNWKMRYSGRVYYLTNEALR